MNVSYNIKVFFLSGKHYMIFELKIIKKVSFKFFDLYLNGYYDNNSP